MYIVREVFNTKPGKAKELVKKFKQAAPHFEKDGLTKMRIMTDMVSTYWTVVMEFEVNDLGEFANAVRGGTSQPEVAKIMDGYMDLVQGGHREIFVVE